MTPKSASVASTRKAAFPLPSTMIPIQLHARRDADRSSAEDSWENEGGHLPRLDSANRQAATPMPTLGELEGLATEVRIMASTFSRDFANGRVGTRYNTYEHRSRVLRQLTAKLDAMRERKAGLEAQEHRR